MYYTKIIVIFAYSIIQSNNLKRFIMKYKDKLSGYIKANRAASREIEQENRGCGFKSITKIHKSPKNYTRKVKHKNREIS